MGFITALPKRVGKLLLRPIPIVFLLLFRLIKKPTRNLWTLFIILGIFGFMFWVLYPFSMTDISTSKRFDKEMKLGLDLKGGVHLVYRADLKGVPEEERDDVMDGTKGIIERRINVLGVSETIVQREGDDRLVVQLPGVKETGKAKEKVGLVNLIEFRVLEEDTVNGDILWIRGVDEETGEAVEVFESVEPGEGNYVGLPIVGTLEGEPKTLSSTHFEDDTNIRFDESGRSVLTFQWTQEGKTIIETSTVEALGKPLAHYIGDAPLKDSDEEVVAPIVGDPLEDCSVIKGLSSDHAKELRSLLNAGRIQVPLELIWDHTVDPTLGEKFVQWSMLALMVGLGLVMLFMILYYRVPGVLASFALLIYAIVVLAIFKLVGVTLTLAGVGGFVLSIGMAVDANVLIFERMKEELRAGRTLKSAIDVGFDRAWVAILHGNVSTLVICLVLRWFGSSIVESAPVVGFATTLAIGVGVSMLSAIVVTRNFLRFFTGAQMARRRTWFGSEVAAE